MWYDAFGGNVAGVNVSGVTSNKGSAKKNFGDAFKDIGKSISENSLAKENSELNALKMQNEENKLTKYNEELGQKNLDDAFSTNYMQFKNKDAYDSKTKEDEVDWSGASPNAQIAQRAFFVKQDNVAQIRFNDEAVETSVVGNYADMKKFVDANPELVKNADGVTMAKIDKYFSDKDSTLAKLGAKEKDVKHATALSKMQAKIVKANTTNGKNDFKYTEQTDAKIASQVKTAMGMDAPGFIFDDTKRVEYQNAVAGSAKISKEYSLEPSLAIYVYQNPDLYDFSADGKVLVKKQDQEPKKEKTSSWKDYQ